MTRPNTELPPTQPRLGQRTADLRQRLVVILTAADRALTTAEILTRLADEGRQCNSSRAVRGQCAHGWANRYGATCAGGCWHPRAYPQLLALERGGIVSHVPRTDRSPCAHWWLKDSAENAAHGPTQWPASGRPGSVASLRLSGRSSTPRIVRLRRALLAVLADTQEPLSTDQVRQALPLKVAYTAVYSQLCRLTELGLVQHKPRFAAPTTKCALWTSVADPENDAAINAVLETFQ